MAQNDGTTPVQGTQDSGMTFDAAPVSQDTPASQPASTDAGMTFDSAPVQQDTSADEAAHGEQINDVGNKVIVPKEGESFSDTMQRAAAQGKVTTQSQLDAEAKTSLTKAGEVLAAAPVIGFVQPAIPALAAEFPNVTKEIVRQAAEAAEGKAEVVNKTLEAFNDAYPELSKLVGKLGFGKTAGTLGVGYASWELFKHIMGVGK